MVNPLISPAEANFITTGVAEDLRGDGRSRTQFRDMVVETGVLANASGSCRLKLDGTDVLVGVKVDVGATDAERPGEGRFECSVDCAPTATAGFEGATSLDDLTLELTQLVSRRLTPAGLPGVDFAQLGIIEGSQCWIVYVDAMVLAVAGNVEDCLFLAIKAALATTTIPGIQLVEQAQGDMDFEILDDPSAARPVPGADQLPLCVTVNKIGHRHVLDATALEEQVASARLHVFATPNGNVTHIQKSGRGGIEPALLRDMSSVGRRAAVQLHHRLAEALKREAEHADTARRTGVKVKKFGLFA
ncbi:hypothetical protein H9P43_001576 [Blastocladiella emersonii ATCC 22665]|nr:hypothetical protein H9P43_001576 [Blastocladiella emersonii ATCC 22665]